MLAGGDTEENKPVGSEIIITDMWGFCDSYMLHITGDFYYKLKYSIAK